MGMLYGVLLLTAATFCWALTLFGLPGNWLMLALAALYDWLAPGAAPHLGWGFLIALAVLAVAGEVVEFVAGARGVSKAGGSKRGAALALVGSVAGACVGFFVGIPIPFIGSIVSALLFASLGAMAGAMIGEHWRGRPADHTWRIGKAAFWGRLFGTLGKALLGLVMIVVIAAGLLAA